MTKKEEEKLLKKKKKKRKERRKKTSGGKQDLLLLQNLNEASFREVAPSHRGAKCRHEFRSDQAFGKFGSRMHG